MVLLGEILSILAGTTVLIVVLLGLVLFVAVLIQRKKVWKWYLIFPIIVLVSFWRMEWASEESYVDSNVQYHIVGKVNKVVEKEENRQIYLYGAKAYALIGEAFVEPITLKGIILWEDSMEGEILPGDVISCNTYLNTYDVARNPGNFDAKVYYGTQNIEFYGWAKEIQFEDRNDNPWVKGIFELKGRIKESFEEVSMGVDAGIYSSLVLGDKSLLDVEIKNLYQVNGIAHILAISGLHVSIIGFGLYKLLRKGYLPFWVCFVISFLIIVSYGIMTGNSVSSVRAIVMFLMRIFADVLGRGNDILSGMGFSAVIILWMYPKMIYNSGFLLSFLAVLGIVVIKPAFDYLFRKEDWKKHPLRVVLDGFLTSLSINLATLPVILNSYYEIPVYSVFLNIIIVPLMTFLMVSSVVGGILGMFCVPLGAFCVGLAHYILAFYEWICRLFLKLPGSVLILGEASAWQVFFYYLCIVVMVLCIMKSRKIQVFLMCLALVVITFRSQKDFVLRMLDVGQGDSIHISSKGVEMLVDGGSTSEKEVGKYRLIPYLKSQGVSQIDCMVISHADTDHISGLLEILEDGQIRVNMLMLPNVTEKSANYQKIEALAKKSDVPIQYIYAGTEFVCGEITVKCLHPGKKYVAESENDSSAVLLLSYGTTDVLLTGDVEDRGENAMLKENVLHDIDILKVAHHGSRYSTDEEFLDVIMPEMALISCSEGNSYGHPHEETLQRLEAVGCEILTTPECGAITVKIDEEIEVYGFVQ